MLEFRDDIITIHVFSFYTDKATNPLNKETDWDNVKGFCDQLSNEPEGWGADERHSKTITTAAAVTSAI